MYKTIILILISIATLLRADQPGPNIINVGVTININDQAIHSREIIEPLLPQLRKLAQENDPENYLKQASLLTYQETMQQISDILLFQQAKKVLGRNNPIDKILESIRKSRRDMLIANYGGNEARARAELASRGLQMEDVLEAATRSALVMHYRESYFSSTKTITRAAMFQYYQNNLEEKFTLENKIQFQLIDIRFDRVDGIENANELLEELMAQLNNNADFTAMVQQYSHSFCRSQDGFWPEMSFDEKGQAQGLRELYQPVVDALLQLEPGQFCQPISLQDRFLLAKLIKKQNAGIIPFSQVQEQIRKTLQDQEWTKIGQKLQKELETQAVFGYLPNFSIDTAKLAYQKIQQEKPSDAEQQ